MAATLAALKTYLGVLPATVTDDEAMGAAVEAANDYVADKRPDLTETEPWPPRINHAAIVEAARLYGRRGSVQGVAAFADVGVAYLPGTDPEVKSLLELGEHQRSVVA